MRTQREKYLKNVVTLDPGLHTGIALWDGTDDPVVSELSVQSDLVCCSKPVRVLSLADSLDRFITENISDIKCAVIEDVGLWWGKDIYSYHPKLGKCFLIPTKFDHSTSIIAARKGHTFFVAMMVGSFIHRFGLYGIPVNLVSVQKWKGHLNKKQVADKVESINGKRYKSDHISDAVGIGFSAVGRIVQSINFSKELVYAKRYGKRTGTSSES